jgi:hypothetical protein
MNDLTQKLIVALVIVPVLIGIFRGAKEMGIAVLAITAALFFANLDKFERFKGGGIEAELRTVVNKAYAAIEQLRELGLSLSSPIVDELSLGMLEHYHLKYKLERVAKIEETLKKLGASEKEIEEACSAIYRRVTYGHIEKVIGSLLKSNPGKESLIKGLHKEETYYWGRSELEKFIKDNDLKKSEETEAWIRDLNYFLENKKLKREEQWEGY